jgi:hypothetical protein
MVCPETWNWEIAPSSFEFVNGTNESSQNPEIQFNMAAPYSITLTVNNTNGSVTLQKGDYISAGGHSIPFFEDFENGYPGDYGWTIVNPNNDNTTWEMFQTAGNGGNHAAGIEFFSYYAFMKRDQFISPPIDLSATNNAVLNFEHAYALMAGSNYSDSLIVKISTDCGNSWERVLALADDGSGNFATRESMASSFVPATQDDWCGNGYGSDCIEADISAWAGTPDVQIMFESVRMAGNNLYIDNVSVATTVGIENIKLEQAGLFIVFPNPSDGKFSVKTPKSISKIEMKLYNMKGMLVMSQSIKSYSGNFNIDLTNQTIGIYLVQFVSDGYSEAKKIVIE